MFSMSSLLLAIFASPLIEVIFLDERVQPGQEFVIRNSRYLGHLIGRDFVISVPPDDGRHVAGRHFWDIREVDDDHVHRYQAQDSDPAAVDEEFSDAGQAFRKSVPVTDRANADP